MSTGACAIDLRRCRSTGADYWTPGAIARDAGCQVRGYRRLMATTRAVVRDATTVVRRISQRLRTAAPSVAATLIHARERLQQMQPLVTRLLARTPREAARRRHARAGQSAQHL